MPNGKAGVGSAVPPLGAGAAAISEAETTGLAAGTAGGVSESAAAEAAAAAAPAGAAGSLRSAPKLGGGPKSSSGSAPRLPRGMAGGLAIEKPKGVVPPAGDGDPGNTEDGPNGEAPINKSVDRIPPSGVASFPTVKPRAVAALGSCGTDGGGVEAGCKLGDGPTGEAAGSGADTAPSTVLACSARDCASACRKPSFAASVLSSPLGSDGGGPGGSKGPLAIGGATPTIDGGCGACPVLDASTAWAGES